MASFDMDQNCTPAERRAIHRSVNAMNDVVEDIIIEINNIVDVDYEAEKAPEADHSIIMCLHMDHVAQQFPRLKGSTGMYTFDILHQQPNDIWIRSDLLHKIQSFQSVCMHELIHVLGPNKSDHSDNPNDVFYGFWHPTMPIRYTDADSALIHQWM